MQVRKLSDVINRGLDESAACKLAKLKDNLIDNYNTSNTVGSTEQLDETLVCLHYLNHNICTFINRTETI